MKIDAQASFADRLFRTSQHDHSVTRKTMKIDAQGRPPAGIFGQATDEGMLGPGADARAATRHAT